MNWTSALAAFVVAPALVVQAAEQTSAPSQPKPAGAQQAAAAPKPVAQPKIEARKSTVLTKGGLTFRDLNKNGVLDPYEDWRLPVAQRVSDLVARMTVEEKTGLMIHSSLAGFTGPNGEVLGLPATGGRGGAGRGAALLDVVFGKAKVTGKLPFDVPSDMPSVMAQAADVPFDMVDPMFKFGFGLSYKR